MANNLGPSHYFLAKERFHVPDKYLEDDIAAIYERGEIAIGWKDGATRIFETTARKNSLAIIGVQYGDEGKGRIVDNEVENLLTKVKHVNVIRFQGGSNAGHTIHSPSGQKVALHQVPSSIMYEQAMGIMDTGMIIHPEDLVTELEDAEAVPEVGDLRGKMLLSENAMLATDLDRAREVLNRKISEGKSGGGTGSGISPVVADKIARLGMSIKDFIADNWREKLGAKYDLYVQLFNILEMDLASMQVSDLKETRRAKEKKTHPVGSKEEFLDRLETARKALLERHEQSLVQHGIGFIVNTYKYHGDIYQNLDEGILFEGSQSVGLDRDIGRDPDVTSTNTTVHGIYEGTQFSGYQAHNIDERIGIMKLTYMSSVGSAVMLTDSGIERKVYTQGEIAALQAQDKDKAHAAWIRNEAGEFGTTTGRARDICWLNLELIRFNASIGPIEMLAATHLDIAREDQSIKVCTHYTNAEGQRIPYQPGMDYQKGAIPHYIELPGWDGEAASKARSLADLPENVRKFLAFVQRNLGIPITMVTNGYERDAFIEA